MPLFTNSSARLVPAKPSLHTAAPRMAPLASIAKLMASMKEKTLMHAGARNDVDIIFLKVSNSRKIICSTTQNVRNAELLFCQGQTLIFTSDVSVLEASWAVPNANGRIYVYGLLVQISSQLDKVVFEVDLKCPQFPSNVVVCQAPNDIWITAHTQQNKSKTLQANQDAILVRSKFLIQTPSTLRGVNRKIIQLII